MNGSNQQNIRDIHIIGQDTREWIITDLPKSTGFSVTLAGISHAKYPFHFKRTAPPMLHVLACWAGRGKVLINGRLHTCSPGEAYITPPDQLHEYRAVGKQVWKIAWMHIHSRDASVYPSQPTLKQVESDWLREIISGMYRETISDRDKAVMESWSMILHRQCLRLLGEGGTDFRLQKLWEVVDANLSQDWTLEKMAEISNLSEEHLRRLCVRQFGQPPIRRLTAMRMKFAAALLISSSLKVEKIAEMVGYKNPLAFSTAFRKYIGIAPTAFRKSKGQKS